MVAGFEFLPDRECRQQVTSVEHSCVLPCPSPLKHQGVNHEAPH